jgi:hypothetical protein
MKAEEEGAGRRGYDEFYNRGNSRGWYQVIPWGFI